MHLQHCANHGRPFLYPGQAVVVGVHGGGIEAYAIVPDHKINPVAAKGQARGHLLGGGVTLHVNQRLFAVNQLESAMWDRVPCLLTPQQVLDQVSAPSVASALPTISLASADSHLIGVRPRDRIHSDPRPGQASV